MIAAARRAPPGRLTVLAPGLLGPWPEALHRDITAGLETPALCRLLARADRARPAPRESRVGGAGAGPSMESLIRAAAGCETPAPAAPVTMALDGAVAPDEWLMRADPVHLRAEVGTAYLVGAEHLAVERDEADRLVAELNRALDAPFTIEAPHPARWYLRLPGPTEVVTHAPLQVGGRDLGSFLPAGAEGREWRRWLNEIQMLLHGSEVNAAREASGRPTVNSVWFWGQGSLPRTAPGLTGTCLWSDDPYAQGLGALGWVEARPLPPEPAAWLGALDLRRAGGHQIVSLDHCLAAWHQLDVEAWRRALVQLEHAWFEGLGRAHAAGRVPDLQLWTGSASPAACYRAGRLSRWRRWRRPGELARWLQGAVHDNDSLIDTSIDTGRDAGSEGGAAA